MCFRVSLQIPLRQVGACLDKETFKTRYSFKPWKRICILTSLKVGNEFENYRLNCILFKCGENVPLNCHSVAP